LEYYDIRQIHWMSKKCGIKLIDLEFNDLNGGSVLITAAKQDAPYEECTTKINDALKREEELGLKQAETYAAFANDIEEHRSALKKLISDINKKGEKVFGYGASTKGNMMIQYCGFTNEDIPYFAEVNEDKFGKFTPHSNIPIISESDAKSLKPDYFMVMPWHFRDFILEKESEWIKAGGKFIFPLPEIEIIG